MDLKEQYFGTEIEMTGITREEAANAVGELFGTQPYYIGTYYSTWGVRDLEGKGKASGDVLWLLQIPKRNCSEKRVDCWNGWDMRFGCLI